MFRPSALPDEHFMNQALQEAERAFDAGEVPIGAVVVCGGRIIGRGHNQTERLQDPTAHAEMLAITAACESLGTKYLSECTMYVTVEPCSMCAGAMRWSQLQRLVYGAPEEKFGFTQFNADILHPKTEVAGGLLAADARELMQRFFAQKRRS